MMCSLHLAGSHAEAELDDSGTASGMSRPMSLPVLLHVVHVNRPVGRYE